MELVNIAGIALLMLLVRKLLWCVRWLWCYYHGKETPAPISFIPRQTGELFEGHIRKTKESDGED